MAEVAVAKPLVQGPALQILTPAEGKSLQTRIIMTSSLNAGEIRSNKQHSVVGHMVVRNAGSTALFYSWEKDEEEEERLSATMSARSTSRMESKEAVGDGPYGDERDVFGTLTAADFFCHQTRGVLVPGQEVDFSFTFKTPIAGVFSEGWKLKTKPALNSIFVGTRAVSSSGTDGVPVVLRGIAIEEDTHAAERSMIDKKIERGVFVDDIRQILVEAVDMVKVCQIDRSMG